MFPSFIKFNSKSVSTLMSQSTYITYEFKQKALNHRSLHTCCQISGAVMLTDAFHFLPKFFPLFIYLFLNSWIIFPYRWILSWLIILCFFLIITRCALNKIHFNCVGSHDFLQFPGPVSKFHAVCLLFIISLSFFWYKYILLHILQLFSL